MKYDIFFLLRDSGQRILYQVDLMTTNAIMLLKLQSARYMWDKEMEFLKIETKSPKLISI